MDSHALGLLDFESVIRDTKDFCFSDIGRRALDSQEILTVQEKVGELVSATTAFREVLLASTDFPELAFPDIEPSLKPLTKTGAVLEPIELAYIAVCINSAMRLKKYLQKNITNSFIGFHVRDIPDLGELARAILAYIHEDGEIKDEKIPVLAGLKKNCCTSTRKSEGSSEVI